MKIEEEAKKQEPIVIKNEKVIKMEMETIKEVVAKVAPTNGGAAGL